MTDSMPPKHPKHEQESTALIERIVSFEISSIDEYTFQMKTFSGQNAESVKVLEINPMLPSQCSEFDAIRDQHIRGGGVPPHEEFVLLDKFKAQWGEELSLLQSQVDQMNFQLNQLYTTLISTVFRIRQTEVYFDICDSLRAPIRHLPSEILSNVFYLCIPENKSPRADSAPLHLRRVCKYWNDIVVNNGTLWNRIRFDVDSKLTTSTVNRIERIMAMYHSGPKATIPFSLGLFTTATNGENGLHNQIMPLITPHLPQCNHLYLGCTNTGWYRRFSTISPLQLKALESLYINFKETSGNSHLKLDCFTKSPKLKTLSLILWKSEHISQFVFPYRQLSSLSVSMRINQVDHPTPISSWENLVKQCRNLKFLQVDFQHHHADRKCPLNIDNATSSRPPTTLFSLRTFKFVSDFSGYLTDFVKAFEFPHLISLSVDALHPFHLSPRDGSPLAQLLHSQGQLSFFAGLVELELLHVSLCQEEIQDVLNATVRLEKLTMMNLLPDSPRWGMGHCLVENDTLLNLLIISSSSSPNGEGKLPLAPRLANLHLFHAAARGQLNSAPFPTQKVEMAVTTRHTWLTLGMQSTGELYPPKFHVQITFEEGCAEISSSVEQSLRMRGVGVSVDLSRSGFQKNIDRSFHYSYSIHPCYPL